MWWHPLLLTLQLMAVSVVISGVIGVCGAWAASSLESSGPGGKWVARLFLAAMVAAIAMPMILHVAAWEATAGKFGWLPLTQTGSRKTTLGAFGAFGGLLASGWIHGLVGSSIVALATWHAVRRVPTTVILHSQLDAGPLAVWWRIRLPIAMPWLITSLLGVAALAATEMTVVDLYGFRTIADEFYLFYAKNATIEAILMSCLLPLAIVACSLLVLLVWRRRLPAVASSDGHRDDGWAEEIAEQLPCHVRYLATAVALLIASIVVVVPIAGLLVKVGHQIVIQGDERMATWSLSQCVETLAGAPVTFAQEYQWTAILAVLTATAAVMTAWVPAALGRTHGDASKGFDLVSILMVLTPGPIVGLAVVYFFQMQLPGFRLIYQQTVIPTVIALLFRASPVAYWVLRAGYRGIEDTVLESARLDRSWFGRFWHVDRPLLRRPLMAAFLASAVVASGDVPAMLPVIPPGVTTVGTRLFELLHSGARYQEAALALWYVAAVVTIVVLWMRWARKRGKMIG